MPENVPFAETSGKKRKRKKIQNRSLKKTLPDKNIQHLVFRSARHFLRKNVRFYFVLCEFPAVYYMHSIVTNIR